VYFSFVAADFLVKDQDCGRPVVVAAGSNNDIQLNLIPDTR